MNLPIGGEICLCREFGSWSLLRFWRGGLRLAYTCWILENKTSLMEISGSIIVIVMFFLSLTLIVTRHKAYEPKHC